MDEKQLTIVGQAEKLSFPELNIKDITARIDTGARTSSIWASNIRETKEGLSFCLFGKGSPYYTGKRLLFTAYDTRMVTSSMGHVQSRFVIKLGVEMKNKKIKASFTLADRSQQVYPVLVGRNVLRGKFLVDVKQGEPLKLQEELLKARYQQKIIELERKNQ